MNINATLFKGLVLWAALGTSPGAAFGETSQGATAPLAGSLTLASGEVIEIDGTVSVEAAGSIGEGGAARVQYVCETSGGSRAEAPATPSTLAGSDFGEVHSQTAFPADVGMRCLTSLARADGTYRIQVNLQASLDAQGKLLSVVMRELTLMP